MGANSNASGSESVRALAQAKEGLRLANKVMADRDQRKRRGKYLATGLTLTVISFKLDFLVVQADILPGSGITKNRKQALKKAEKLLKQAVVLASKSFPQEDTGTPEDEMTRTVRAMLPVQRKKAYAALVDVQLQLNCVEQRFVNTLIKMPCLLDEHGKNDVPASADTMRALAQADINGLCALVRAFVNVDGELAEDFATSAVEIATRVDPMYPYLLAQAVSFAAASATKCTVFTERMESLRELCDIEQQAVKRWFYLLKGKRTRVCVCKKPECHGSRLRLEIEKLTNESK